MSEYSNNKENHCVVIRGEVLYTRKKEMEVRNKPGGEVQLLHLVGLMKYECMYELDLERVFET